MGIKGVTTTVVYTTTILGTFVWSGSTTEKTLYDRYLVSLSGIRLEVAAPDGVGRELSDYLDFLRDSAGINERPAVELVDKADVPTSQVRLKLPEHRFLDLVPSQRADIGRNSPVALLFKVKNGFWKLQRELCGRIHHTVDSPPPLESPNQSGTTVVCSEVQPTADGGFQFTVTPVAGPTVIFFRPRFWQR